MPAKKKQPAALAGVEASPFVFKRRIGEGAYGIVYETEEKAGGRTVAVKRNVVDSGMHGIMSLKEADMFAKLSRHPHIVDCVGVFFGGREQFPDKIGRKFDDDSVDDRIHFILGHEQTTVESHVKHFSMSDIKAIAIQLLLGVEWMHVNSVVHRDIKPANILVSRGSDGAPRVKICDFGLAGYAGGGAPLTTPGIVTSWYRAPEICMERTYSEKVDVWSVGTVLFELLARTAFLANSGDEDVDIIASILKRAPEIASLATITDVGGGDSFATFKKVVFPKLNAILRNRFSNPADFDPLAGADADTRRKAVAARIRVLALLSDRREAEFTTSPLGGDIHAFYDLVASMLVFDPAARTTAAAALDSHPYFAAADAAAYIAAARKNFTAADRRLPSVVITACAARRTAYTLVVEIYNNRFSIDWYSHRVLFHALDALDRCLEVEPAGRDDAPDTVYLKMYTLMYMYHKLFTCMDLPERWRDFAPAVCCSGAARQQSLDFEAHVFERVFRREVFRDTLFEVMAALDARVRESRVRECIVKWGGMDRDWAGGSVRALHREVFAAADG